MAEDPVRKELEALKADIAKLREDLGALTEAVKEAAGERVQGAKARAADSARGAWEEVERRLNDVLGQGREAVDQVEQRIAEHPGGSLLTAFGLGFIIGKLMDLGGRR